MRRLAMRRRAKRLLEGVEEEGGGVQCWGGSRDGSPQPLHAMTPALDVKTGPGVLGPGAQSQKRPRFGFPVEPLSNDGAAR
jgi:hypothetical protein